MPGAPRARAPGTLERVKILLTGSAGFIGTAIADALEADGDEVVRVDLMLPQAHGAATAPTGTHQIDVREAVDGPDGPGPTCCAASTRSATRRPSSAPG